MFRTCNIICHYFCILQATKNWRQGDLQTRLTVGNTNSKAIIAAMLTPCQRPFPLPPALPPKAMPPDVNQAFTRPSTALAVIEGLEQG